MFSKFLRISLTLLLAMGFFVMLPGTSQAHCDKLDGPVATAALEALDAQNFQKIQIWVGAEQEKELKRAFEQTLNVRGESSAAKALADRYFIETAVRLHREAEGMPYTGVKPAGIPNPEDIVAGDRAIQSGSVDTVMSVLIDALRSETEQWFDAAMEARQHRDQSVEAGREWVDAYVKYIVFVHGLYQQIQSGPAHGVGD